MGFQLPVLSTGAFIAGFLVASHQQYDPYALELEKNKKILQLQPASSAEVVSCAFNVITFLPQCPIFGGNVLELRRKSFVEQWFG